MAAVLVIIPTYNEIAGIRTILDRVRAAVPSADILVVDDSSPDGTGALADEIAATDDRISVLHRAAKDGLGQAYIAGFRHALDRGYAFVCQLDSDGSHDPAELPSMLAIARDRADLVVGSRWVPGGRVLNWPRSRELISRTGNVYSRIALRSRIRDITGGFRVFRAAALRSLDLGGVASQGYCFQVEMAWNLERSGAIVVEHAITFVERESGESKMHTGIVIEALLRVTLWGVTSVLRPRRPQRPTTERP